jgi:hypothetical protein
LESISKPSIILSIRGYLVKVNDECSALKLALQIAKLNIALSRQTVDWFYENYPEAYAVLKQDLINSSRFSK